MKFHIETTNKPIITSYNEDYIEIDKIKINNSLIIAFNQVFENWNCKSFNALNPKELLKLSKYKDIDLIILGTGKNQHFINQSWLKPLVEQNIALETMTTFAACRTYNILVAEDRRVLGAFILD